MKIIINQNESDAAYGIFEKKVNEQFPDLFDDPHDIWDRIDNGKTFQYHFTQMALKSNKDKFKDYVESVSDSVGYQYDDSVTKVTNRNRLHKAVVIHITDLLTDIALDALEGVIGIPKSFLKEHGLNLIISEGAYRIEIEEDISWYYSD